MLAEGFPSRVCSRIAVRWGIGLSMLRVFVAESSRQLLQAFSGILVLRYSSWPLSSRPG